MLCCLVICLLKCNKNAFFKCENIDIDTTNAYIVHNTVIQNEKKNVKRVKHL